MHLALFRSRLTAFLVSLAAITSAGAEFLLPGHVIDPISCRRAPEQTYALYLPSGYTSERAWPVMFCFDPMARGRVPVERFQAAADHFGYIVIGSNNARNGAWNDIAAAARAVIEDAQARYRIDPDRLYAAGFSGGARAAFAIAHAARMRGVFASCGGFPADKSPDLIPFAYYCATGRTDFNHIEMLDTARHLEHLDSDHRLEIFDGGHDWPPPSVAHDALAWFDILAMRDGAKLRDINFLESEFSSRLQRAAALPRADQTHAAYRSLIRDFAGLIDTREVSLLLGKLEKSRTYSRAVRAAQKERRQEQEWTTRLATAIQDTGITQAPRLADPFARRRRAEPLSERPGTDQDTWGRPDNPDDSWNRVDVQTFPFPVSADRFDRLRRVVADLRRRAKKSPAAQRALSAVFIRCLNEGQLHAAQNNHRLAADAFEAATIIFPHAGAAYFELARLHAAQRRFARARELVLAATAKGYDNTDALRELQVVLDSSGASDAPAPTVASTPTQSVIQLATRESFRATTPSSPRDRSRASTSVQASRSSDDNTKPLVTLDSMRVSGQPICSFGLGLRILAIPGTRQISRIIINQVAPESDAEFERIEPGDEISRIDGRSIHSFTAHFDRDSDFGRYFVGRKTGERIRLEIISPASGRRREVVLQQGWTYRDAVPGMRVR